MADIIIWPLDRVKQLQNAKTCEVCRERPKSGLMFCAPCRRSFAAMTAKEGDIASVILWTARRSAYYEGKRRKKRAR